MCNFGTDVACAYLRKLLPADITSFLICLCIFPSLSPFSSHYGMACRKYTLPPKKPVIPGGFDFGDNVYEDRVEHPDESLRERMLAHIRPPDNFATLRNTSPQVQYFDYVVGTAMARNPNLPSSVKQRLRREMIEELVLTEQQMEERRKVAQAEAEARAKAEAEEERKRAAARLASL